MVIVGVLCVASGLFLGVQVACLWGLRKVRDGWPDLLLVGLFLVPLAYFWGASAFGWPTPGSIAKSVGLLTWPGDRALFVILTLVPAVIVVAVLVKSGVTRRLERWAEGSAKKSE